ncbi:hypothetical protein Acsp04_66100 [Actinomadura sp. NBRC 104425]|uniref:hypothetical protein n=1 Tax=Actinomadura sp. NBRC 104425 TaxID=3032204 RepID=UPI0024A3F75C|nr:hypothetical protein [Actinomadura sp. NBRC 104425]GLZ16375.1 hypothetical protein Acsp04_66100 [Actinomadura sp. NBRC 104425]
MDDRENRTDKDTERFAAELNERVRILNGLTEGAPGLTQPETAYTVLGNLAQTAFRLSQTAEHLDAFLDRELNAGRLEHDHGDDPEPSVLKAHDALAQATEQSMDLGEAFRRAQGALAAIHAREGDTDLSLRNATKPAVSQAESVEGAAEPEPAAKDFPKPIGDVISEPVGKPSPPGARPNAAPPKPRREV